MFGGLRRHLDDHRGLRRREDPQPPLGPIDHLDSADDGDRGCSVQLPRHRGGNDAHGVRADLRARGAPRAPRQRDGDLDAQQRRHRRGRAQRDQSRRVRHTGVRRRGRRLDGAGVHHGAARRSHGRRRVFLRSGRRRSGGRHVERDGRARRLCDRSRNRRCPLDSELGPGRCAKRNDSGHGNPERTVDRSVIRRDGCRHGGAGRHHLVATGPRLCRRGLVLRCNRLRRSDDRVDAADADLG